MFNNPFGSFQNTVAEAKEEREQLDRLLTISTPRERLLVVVIALLVFVLAVWVFFGSVTRTVALDGVLVQPGDYSAGTNRSVQTFVWANRGVALQMKAGMPATIELASADGNAETLYGEVAAISAVPSGKQLAAIGSAAPVTVHRVVITLDEGLDYTSVADRKCRIVIELGEQPLVRLLQTRPS